MEPRQIFLLLLKILALQTGTLVSMAGLYVLSPSRSLNQVLPMGIPLFTLLAECPENCDAHGTCQANGACICDNGWAGLDCSSGKFPRNFAENSFLLVLNPLAATGKTVTFSSVKVNAWVYYNVTVTSATTVLVQVKEVSTSGYLQVYVAKTTPTLTNFMYGDLSSNAVHRIAIDTPQGGANTWIVGVYGDAEQVDPNGTSFGIVAWSPVFV